MSRQLVEHIRTDEIDYKIEEAIKNHATQILLQDDRGNSGCWVFTHDAVCLARYEIVVCDNEGTKYMLSREDDELLVTPTRVDPYPLPMKDFNLFEKSVFEFLKGVII
jgi:hypothetical protein